MDFNIADNYQLETRRTAPKSKDEIKDLINYVMGMTGESLEVLELVSNVTFFYPNILKGELVKELGDTLWYVARFADVFRFKLSFLLKTDTFDEFQSRLDKLADYANTHLGEKRALIYFSTKLSTGSGKVCDYIKKIVFQGHKINSEHIKYMLRKILIFIGVITILNGISISDVANKNVEKLRKRYPNGFNVEDSVNREE